ncbi:5-methylcytosine restriction system specificity protein McrC [Aequorivita sinensis]|uniref:5-methylcytosine restriction system specificity protein McrC n=1 Tax=Aequorivita sinensis TaxID=1382458 RepID=UPI0022FFD35A|nr:restriction endonuclease [Aequorivita sinensis]
MDILTKNPFQVWEHFKQRTDLFYEHESVYAEIVFPKERGDGFCAQVKKSPGENQAQLETSYFIGVDRFPNTNQSIYVAPKLNRSPIENTEDWVEVDYIKMLFQSLSNPELMEDLEELFIIKWDEEEIELKGQQDFLTPFLVVQFLGVVKNIVRKGLKKSYYRVEQNLKNRIKGKILVGQTIKQNHFKHKYLDNYCSYEEFGINGIENRLLKKALEFVKPYLYSHTGIIEGKGITDLFNFINPAFSQVPSNFDFSELRKVKRNPFYKDYTQALDLAEKILRRFGYNISNSSKTVMKSTPPFWIDMSKLFEIYVLGLLKKEFSNSVKFQYKTHWNELDYILKNKDYQLVIDAKYKTIYSTHYDIHDIRQISGYARLKNVRKELGITDDDAVVPNCLIVYPTFMDDCANFNNRPLLANPINTFKNIYKIGVNLPIQNNQIVKKN